MALLLSHRKIIILPSYGAYKAEST